MKDDRQTELGERLRSWRLSAGISQREFASRAGIQQPTVSNYENGKRDVPFAVVGQYARTAGISIDLLTSMTHAEALAARKTKPRKTRSS